jgi:hypothetical protein
MIKVLGRLGVGEEDELTQFLYWWLHQPNALTLVPLGDNGLIAHESVVTLTLFRAGEFQVELVMLLPNAKPWPGEHRHPDVDSYEVAIDTDNASSFTRNGKEVTMPDLVVPVEVAPGEVKNMLCVRLTPDDWHGTKPLGAKGGVLFSVQRWLNGVKPTSVGKNWDGQPVVEGHKAILEQTDAKLVCH